MSGWVGMALPGLWNVSKFASTVCPLCRRSLQEAAIAEIRQAAREEALVRLSAEEANTRRRAQELAEARQQRRLDRAWLSGAVSPAHGLRRRARLMREAGADGGVDRAAAMLSRVGPSDSMYVCHHGGGCS